MNFKKIFSIALLAAGCITASAQSAEPEMVDAFNPHWYVQAQVGGQYTLGERNFGDLLSPNVQGAIGYMFTPGWGLRLDLNAWQSKGGSTIEGAEYGWKYKYIAPTLSAQCDLTNLICGFKADRVFNFGLLAGIGANIAWDNGEAYGVQQQVLQKYTNLNRSDVMGYLWGGTKSRVAAKFGAYADFRVAKNLAVGLELNCNTLDDHYNSKPAGNSDWYFNALVGVKYHFGKTTKKVKKENPCGEIIVEKPVEKIVEKVVYRDREVAAPGLPNREPLRRDIFFVIRGSEVSKAEMTKVEEVAAYLNKYADAKVNITGYADKGTGNPTLNVGYARKRAQMVADILTNRFGIASSRIIVDSKGDTVQPYEKNELNRVSICIAE